MNSHIRGLKFALFFLLIFKICSYAVEIPTIEVYRDKDLYDDFKLALVENKNGHIDIENIRDSTYKIINNSFALGYINHNVWFGIKIENIDNRSYEAYLEMTEPFAQIVDFYVIEKDDITISKNGNKVDIKNREIRDSNPILVLNLEANSSIEVWINYSSYFGSFGSFILQNEKKYLERLQNRNGLYWFYFGALVVFAFFSFFLFLLLKERLYFYYFGYISSFVFWIWLYSGFAIYAIPLSLYYPFHIATPLTLIFLILFSRELLSICTISKNIDLVLKFLIFINIIAIVLMPFLHFYAYYIFNLTASPALLLLLYASTKVSIKDNTVARFYFFALSIFIASAFLLTLSALGIYEYKSWVKKLMIIGSLLEIMLFSSALAYRFAKLKEEKLKAQDKLLDLSKKQQSVLEREVASQTRKLKSALKQKELLFKELHHRVKNNLQLIVSMIELQKDVNKISKESINTLANIGSRVRSMAILHQMLNDSSLKNIDLRNYIDEMVKKMILSYSLEEKTIDIDIKRGIVINSDTLINIGLIINEIITNSIKHTFLKTNSSKIYIKIKLIDDEILKIEIGDSGKGYPKEVLENPFDRDESGIGMILVDVLVKQLKGSIELKNSSDKGGAVTIVIIPTNEN